MKKSILKLRQIFKINTKSDYGITWHNYDRRRVVGHNGHPKIGDIFTSNMQSGKIGVFEIINVDWCGDPSNMYFADVKDVGYFETKL